MTISQSSTEPGGYEEREFFGVGDASALEGLSSASDRKEHVLLGLGVTPVARVAPRNAAEMGLLAAYRRQGFLRARLDPLGLSHYDPVPALSLVEHGLSERQSGPLRAWAEHVYCGAIGWEIGHIHDAAQSRWLTDAAERPALTVPDAATRQEILALLARAEAFESGLNQRIPGGKLFGLGGAETFLVALETILTESSRLGVVEVVVGGMHRGRFNMLANVLAKPLGQLVAEILGKPAVPEGMKVSSDVSYHLGWSGEREIAGSKVHISVSPHPSHLQLAPIIAQGRARAKQAVRGPEGRRQVLPLLLHTDASFAGQGLVAEMLQLSGVAPFDIGGTIHVVINNQLGFTTMPEEGRTARHPTDIARLIEVPVLHVNGDEPEAVWRAALVAANWRSTFGRDILINLVCYRRAGHNELDEPRFTQPAMYRAIDALEPVTDGYAARVAGEDGPERAAAAKAAMDEALKVAFESAKSYRVNRADWLDGAWHGMQLGSELDMLAPLATGLATDRLKRLGGLICQAPEGMKLDAKVARFLDERRRSLSEGRGISWASAEALALASLLAEGTPVRLGGQDAVRGAFTQRHLELHCQETGRRHLTLAPAEAGFAAAEIHNTPLIEHAVLTFEYGISLADPSRLVVWEAQFGEFLSYAQPVFDQCIACGEDRWLRCSGLVILLPHGLDGGGPDHSTGRPERLLAACAGANLQVVNASTPANFFHLLRRQMRRHFRKPLVVLSPKALLRHKACVSTLEEMAEGTGFRAVIPDGTARAARRVILCSGKVYYDLAEARAARRLEQSVALVRLEQLHPLPADEIRSALAAHPGADLVWCEEEPANMGCFTHLDRPLERLAGRALRRIGRPAVATPAVGVKYWHEAEVKAFLDAAFEGLAEPAMAAAK